MLRFDLLERIALKIHDQRKGGAAFEPDMHLANSLGVGGETLSRVMRELGFAPFGGPDSPAWRWIGLRRRASQPRQQHPIRSNNKATA